MTDLEQTVFASQDYLALIADTVPALVSYVDTEGRYQFCNATYRQWFELTQDQLIGRPMVEVLGEEVWKVLKPHLQASLAGETREFEAEAKYIRGGTRWIHAIYRPHHDNSGQVIGVVILVLDITDRKRTELALRESRLIMEKALAIETVGVLYFDLKGNIHRANAAFERMTGYSLSELRTMHWKQLTPPDFHPGTSRAAEELRTKGHTRPYEKQMVRKDGSRWWGVFAPTVLSGFGEDAQCMEFIIDITAPKKIERDLRENSRLLDLSTDAIICREWDGSIVFWNHGAQELYGWAREEVLGKNAHELLKTRWPEPFDNIIKTLTSVGAWTGELIHTTRTGEQKTVFCRKVFDRQTNRVLETNTDITARKRFEQDLAKERAFTHAVLRAAPVGIMVADASGKIVRVNPGNDRIWGPSPMAGSVEDYAQYKGWWADGSERDGKALQPTDWAMARALRGEVCPGDIIEIEPFDAPHRRRTILNAGAPIRSDSGEILGAVVVQVDITQEREAQNQLRETEERFRQLAENIPQLAWMTEPDGWITWYNKRWYDYTGTNLEQMQGWGWKEVQHPQHVHRVVRKFQEAIQKGEVWEDTFPLRGKDGQYRWFLSRAFPIRDAAGKIVRWFGSNTDITELRQAEAALVEREDVLRSVARGAGVGLVMLDKDRRFLFANQRHAEIIGYDERSVEGKTAQEVLGDLYPQVEHNMDRAFAGERVKYELHIPRHPKTGDERFAEVVYEPRIDTRGDRYVIVVINDITDRKLAEQKLERIVTERTAELRETNEHLEAFVYSIAHDLRSPLRAMQGYSQILMETAAPQLAEQDRVFLQKINHSAEFMDKMVLDLLAFGRTASTELQFTTVDLKQAWDAAVYQCSRDIDRTGALVEIATPLLKVRAHEPTLAQILANLLNNALKFVEPGTRPHVKFGCTDKGPIVCIWIQDNGVGIDPQYHERIFRVFERLHGTKFSGTGIGLAIVRKGVERMNGKVGVESEVGKGTRFWIELPKA
jgi:PAS domain S-box-containing protein